ncbi:MAG: hypothetical protein LC750_07165 [Actinobacteria bacterium]|nr:hypothetical protein [Actinomycetota bacterium]
MPRMAAILGVAVLAASACGSNVQHGAQGERTPAATSTPGAIVGTTPPPKTAPGKPNGGSGGKPGSHPSEKPGSGSPTPDTGGSPSQPTPKNSPKTTTGGGSSTATFPQPGQYQYDQSGTEKLCQGAACQSYDLPPSETQTISYTSRSKSAAVMVIESKASDQRSVRVTLQLDKQGAGVTNITSHFSVGPFTQTTEITPDPPMQVIRLPLEVGAHWSGTWSGKISGSYSIRVLGQDQVEVAGHSVEAFRMSQVFELSGDVSGKQADTQWFDPATGIVVKDQGKSSFTSQNGTYESQYQHLLHSGPAYS